MEGGRVVGGSSGGLVNVLDNDEWEGDTKW